MSSVLLLACSSLCIYIECCGLLWGSKLCWIAVVINSADHSKPNHNKYSKKYHSSILIPKIICHLNNSIMIIECPKFIPSTKMDLYTQLHTYEKITKRGICLAYNNYYSLRTKVCINYSSTTRNIGPAWQSCTPF